jgi:hypothetical protein
MWSLALSISGFILFFFLLFVKQDFHTALGALYGAWGWLSAYDYYKRIKENK